MSKTLPYLFLLLLAASCFCLATVIQPMALLWSQRGQDSVLKVVLGDGRRLFANHFFTKADVYFHSGYYPSIFDNNAVKENHLAEGAGHPEKEHEEEAGFLARPKDLIERIGRHFMITEHTHLGRGQEREILPWLKLSAELDPQLVNTYTVAAYWLGDHLGKVKEAEDFLREGLRANPDSYEILFSLGRLYYEKEQDAAHARNVWTLALRRWHEQETANKKPDKLVLEEITVNLARLEESQGNLAQAIDYLEQAKALSPARSVLQAQIDELQQKLSSPGSAAARKH